VRVIVDENNTLLFSCSMD